MRRPRTTDEFLIEKRGPLSIPPKMGELPKPRSDSKTKKENKNILGVMNESDKSQEKSEIENIFLEEIRKKLMSLKKILILKVLFHLMNLKI